MVAKLNGVSFLFLIRAERNASATALHWQLDDVYEGFDWIDFHDVVKTTPA
jgi:hypothetical protein